MADTTAAAVSGTTTDNSIGGLNYIQSSTSKKTGSSNINTETFLKLLVAQMQYQDPLEPQSNSDFVAQLAMMAGLEQVQTMNGSLNTSKAMNYIGKQIYATVLDADTGVEEKYSGVVTGVVIKNGMAYVMVGKNAISVDDITGVVDAPADAGTAETTGTAGTTGTTGTTGTAGTTETAGTSSDGGNSAETADTAQAGA